MIAKFFIQILAVILLLGNLAYAQQNKAGMSRNKVDNPVRLWPGQAPGDNNEIGEEKDMSKPGEGLVSGKTVIRLGNVSEPSFTVYHADPKKATGAAVVVCPGGGYSILAYDLEGTEVCEWLNSIGITAVLLKYRVPRREGIPPYAAPLQDVQRTIGLVRKNASAWKINADKIGVMGFSAGGHLSAAASTNYNERTYPVIDDADQLSCKPNFTMLIYPAYLTKSDDNRVVSPELRIDNQTPSTFIVQTQDDPIPIEGSLFYYLALKNSKVPVEMHLYPTGGHGYGLRPQPGNIGHWAKRAEEWLSTITR